MENTAKTDIPNPEDLRYENFTWADLSALLTEAGYMNLSRKKKVVFEQYKDFCVANFGRKQVDQRLLIDPSTLSLEQFDKTSLLALITGQRVD